MRSLLLAAVLLLASGPIAAADGGAGFADWGAETFARAKRERRILIVMVSTSWCHWCHVMKRETYGDARVRRRLAARFQPVYVDADARPDLAERFRNYRWPATAFLTPEAEPIRALRGYRAPERFLAVLDEVEGLWRAGGPYPGFEDPNAGAAPAAPADLATVRALRDRLRAQLDRHYDARAAGWGRPQKYPVAGPLLAAFARAALEPGTPGTRRDLARALDTLGAMRALIDPVDGGMFQYSLEGRWDRWHPEKIVPVNAGALMAYSEALPRARSEAEARAFRAAMQGITRWLDTVLRTPEGVYQASQDADAPRLAGERYYRLPGPERRRYGTPRVDPHVYARENGLVLQALCRTARRLDPPERTLARAVETATRLLASHRDQDGTWRHEAGDTGPRRFLADQVEMGRACLALHQGTGDSRWLAHAQETALVLTRRFAAPGGGYFDATLAGDEVGVFRERRRSLEPNASAARFLLDLWRVTFDARWHAAALGTMVSLSDRRRLEGHWRHVGQLLAAAEVALAANRKIAWHGPVALEGPLLPLAEAVRRAAWASPALSWSFESTPHDGAPFAVVCAADGTCSEPISTAAGLERELERTRGSLPGR